jgi:hypothetical protein
MQQFPHAFGRRKASLASPLIRSSNLILSIHSRNVIGFEVRPLSSLPVDWMVHDAGRLGRVAEDVNVALQLFVKRRREEAQEVFAITPAIVVIRSNGATKALEKRVTWATVLRRGLLMMRAHKTFMASKTWSYLFVMHRLDEWPTTEARYVLVTRKQLFNS